MLLQELINTSFQLAVGFVVAAAIWGVFGRKRAPFTQWVGLTAPASGWFRPTALVFAGLAIFSFLAVVFGPFGDLATGPGTIGGQLQEQGLSAQLFVVILLTALIKTGFTEELIFRGLIAKRLINWLGFHWGNAIQAIIFGSIHLLIFAVPGGPEPQFATVLIVLGLPGFAGWCMGYANEKFGGGSIVPGWFMHAGGNFVSYLHFAT